MSIEDSLGMAPIPYENDNEEVTNLPVISDNSEITPEEDFKKARKSIINILDVGSKAIQEMGSIAYSSQDPDNYESLASMIKSVSDSSMKLLQTHQQLRILSNKPLGRSEPGKVTNDIQQQNIFVGSTMEIAGILKKMRDKEFEDPLNTKFIDGDTKPE